MSNCIEYWKALDISGLLTEADETLLYSHAGWMLESNANKKWPWFKWLMYFSSPALLTFAFSYKFPPKISTVVGGASFLISAYTYQSFSNYNLKKFNQCLDSFLIHNQKFKQFINKLREREIAFFTMGKSSKASLCSHHARVLCINYFRKYAEECMIISDFIKSQMDYSINMCRNMIDENESLANLVGIDKQISDDILKSDPIKNLIQFAIYCRSEMLHMIIIDLMYRNSASRDTEIINKLYEVVKKTENHDYLEALEYLPETHKLPESNILRMQPIANQRRMACIVQLESILEELKLSETLSKDCVSLINELDAVTKILLTHQKENQQHQNSDDEKQTKLDLINDIHLSNEPETIKKAVDSSANVDDNNINCYQVFEAIPGTQDTTTEQRASNKCGYHQNADANGNENDDDYEGFGVSSTSNKGVVLFDELRTVLQPRQEMAMQKEREAIAKFRKVPIEDVKMEDIRDDMNQTTSIKKPTSDDWLEKPFVYHGKGVSLPPTASLFSQLNHRLKVTEATVIGDDESSSSEEEEKSN